MEGRSRKYANANIIMEINLNIKTHSYNQDWELNVFKDNGMYAYK
jgi:hypothetical protein